MTTPFAHRGVVLSAHNCVAEVGKVIKEHGQLCQAQLVHGPNHLVPVGSILQAA